MRNIILLQDAVWTAVQSTSAQPTTIVSVCRDIGSSSLFVLTSNGFLLCVEMGSGFAVEKSTWNLNDAFGGEPDNSWFNVTVVAETGAVVCISHRGSIASIREDPVAGSRYDVVEQEGAVDGGIAVAAWSPDTSNLALVTNNDSLLLMTSFWDVLDEIPLESRVSGSVCDLSWRGDGEYLSIVSDDAVDNIVRVRVYTKGLELISTGRNVADGAGALLRNLGSCVAYATNGSLIAVPQQKTKTKLQVAFLERNGLRHGEIDIQLPEVTAGWEGWGVSSLNWDLPSTLIAVGLKARRADGSAPVAAADITDAPGVVQLYYRGNYHWYLKQQWIGNGLKFLGFDAEIIGRLFLAQEHCTSGSSSEESMLQQQQQQHRSLLRVVDLSWDICSSDTADGTVAVVDGASMLLSPLAYSTVPPPMSLHKAILQRPCRYAAMWSFDSVWGLACLGDDDKSVRLIFANEKGAPTGSVDVNIAAVAESLLAGDSLVFRSVCVTQKEGSTVTLILLASRTLGGETNEDKGISFKLNNSEAGTEYTGRFFNVNGGDDLLILRVNTVDGTIECAELRSTLQPSGSITRIINWPDDPTTVAVGMGGGGSSQGDSFEVVRVSVSIDNQGGEEGREAAVLAVAAAGLDIVGHPIAFPETITHMAVIPSPSASSSSLGGATDDDNYNDHKDNDNDNHADDGSNGPVVVGLSNRNKFYCGEVLLVSGVSSFVINKPLQVLMYVTTGTKPHLHFSSFESLRTVDPLRGEVWEDQLATATMPGAEPRPVERGAKLVLTVPDSPKVILQMPRGNLEAFEPRPLVLMRARSLIDQTALLDCLSLLRRQRVDLNYLIDYQPKAFVDHVGTLVHSALESNAELISLLVSSLVPADVTVTKYPTPKSSTGANTGAWITNRELPSPDFFYGDNKVNAVCAAIREALLPHLHAGKNIALNPVLCTFAKQRPPLLVEALNLIRETSTSPSTSTSTSMVGSSQLSSSKVQAAIKYLAFLAEGSQLFDAALGNCDFEMARAVARQYQMDPKSYLPLLKWFEDMGRGYGKDSWEYAKMHYHVNIYLKRNEAAVDWSMKIAKTYWECLQQGGPLEITDVATTTGTGGGGSSEQKSNSDRDDGKEKEASPTSGGDSSKIAAEMVTIREETHALIVKNTLFEYALPQLLRLVATTTTTTASSTATTTTATVNAIASAKAEAAAARAWLSRLRLAFGNYCLSKQLYKEAVACFLSAEPPSPLDAIKAARSDGDWTGAVSIAARFYYAENHARTHSGGGPPPAATTAAVASSASGDDNSELAPRRVAREIVSEFRESLEQGEAGLFDDDDKVADPWASYAPTSLGGDSSAGDGSSPSSSSSSADKSIEAAQLSLDYCSDAEEAVAILVMSRRWTAAAQAALKTQRMDLLLEEVAPAARNTANSLIAALPSRASRQAALVEELNTLWADPVARLQQVAESEPMLRNELKGIAAAADGEGDMDDTKSEFSMASGASYVSGASGRSIRSASSSVSVLSSLSLTSNTAKSTVSTTFSISGLDHTLLSRGTVSSSEYGGDGKKAEPPRKQRRRDRKRGKGEGGRDLWGLRKEAALADELWSLGNVAVIAKAAKDLCDVLLLIGGAGDASLAAQIQAAVDGYATAVQSNPAPVAPLYAPKWLEHRLMSSVMRFQDIDLSISNQGGVIPQPSISSWWKTAADGIQLWQTYRRTSMIL